MASKTDHVKRMITNPNQASSIINQIHTEERQQFEDLYDQLRKLESGAGDRAAGVGPQVLEKKRELLDQERKVFEISRFIECASEDTDFRDDLLVNYYTRSNAESRSDFFRFFAQSESHNYRVIEKRAQILDNEKPESIPREFSAMYQASIDNLRNMKKSYLVLQTLSEVVFSSWGSKIIAIIAASWLSFVLLITWSGQLDRRFTYYLRVPNIGLALTPFTVAVVLWFLPVLGLASIMRTLASYTGESPRGQLLIEIVLIGVIPGLLLVVGQIIRVYRDVRYEGHYLEDILRAVFIAYLIAGPTVFYFLFTR